jgi:hypothetical protein
MVDCIAWASVELSPEQVNQRRIDARRNGYAAWLWPDVDIRHWRRALEEITSVTRKLLAGEANTTIACDDTNAMCIAAYTSGMGPFLGYWIERGVVRASDEIGTLFRLHLAHNRWRMARLSAVLQNAVEELNKKNIVPLVLKGMDTAFRYFPEPGTRPLSDIDLFVPADSIANTEQVFSSLGYRRVPRMRAPYACDWVHPSASQHPRTLAFVHEEDPWSFDILGSLDKRLPTGAWIGLDSLLVPAARGTGAGRALVMKQPLLTLYLAVHFSQTLLNTTILRALELVLVIRRDCALGVLDWDDFLRAANIIGGVRFIYPALIFAEQLAPGMIPTEVIEAVRSETPKNLRDVVANLTLSTAQPLDRHSVKERFMWAGSWREYLVQIGSELTLDGRGAPFEAAAYSIGTKLWALRRRRYSG